ncbi:hypothetical protein [Parasphingorhabdus sp.]|uniref:hypothetical protein n=1 Tax=Parasphingorhabdus sp. TaxID=2709688 RepID=UPI003267420E
MARLAAFVLALLVTACVPSEPASEDAKSSVSNSESGDASSDAAQTDQKAANTFIAYPDRAGPFTIGTAYTDVAAAHDLSLQYSSEVEDWDNPQATGKGCENFGVADKWPVSSLMFEDGILTRVDFYTPQPDEPKSEKEVMTEKNIGLGSPVADALVAYGASLKQAPHPYLEDAGSYLSWSAGDHGIVFETDTKVITSFRIGTSNSVQYIEGCL